MNIEEVNAEIYKIIKNMVPRLPTEGLDIAAQLRKIRQYLKSMRRWGIPVDMRPMLQFLFRDALLAAIYTTVNYSHKKRIFEKEPHLGINFVRPHAEELAHCHSLQRMTETKITKFKT